MNDIKIIQNGLTMSHMILTYKQYLIEFEIEVEVNSIKTTEEL